MRLLSTLFLAATALSSATSAITINKFSSDPSFQVITQIISDSTTTTTLPSSIQFHPATFSYSFKQSLNAPLVAAYPDTTACNELTQNYTGKVVIAESGGCTSAVKARNAVIAGALAYIEMATSIDPDRRLLQLEDWDLNVAPTWPPVVRIPVTHINYQDGKKLKDALNANIAISVAFKGAGNMPLSETYVIGNMTVAGITFGSQSWRAGLVRAWTGLVETPISNWSTVTPVARTQPIIADGCQNRLAGIWCEDGHVVGLDLYDRGWHGVLTSQIADLTGLKWFHFNGATLKGNTNLPIELGKITTLQVLSISHATITSIPVDSGAYQNLQYLDANDNDLTTATAILKLPSITWLDIANNYISDAAALDTTKFQYLNVMPQHIISAGHPITTNSASTTTSHPLLVGIVGVGTMMYYLF